ncbi:serine hydrolase domain-containing protein [Streptomyces albus]
MKTDTPSTGPGARERRPARTPGVAALVRHPDGTGTHAELGVANMELSVPVQPGTTFNAGSLGKQITAHLAVLSSREGLLRLDQPVTTFLPRFRLTSVTLLDLIRHQGGVRDAESMLSLAGLRELDHYTSDDLLELAYRQSFRCTEPGEFLYSNTGYLLLAAVLRIVYGSDLAELAARRVFEPLGMTTARFVSSPEEVVPGAASSYMPSGRGWLRCQRPTALPGPGTLWCSTTDLDRWLAYLWEAWTPSQQLAFEDDVPYLPSDHEPYVYGPGLYADPRRAGAELVFHYGHEQGFSAAALLFRSGLRVLCLSNHAAVHADHVADTISRAARRTDAGSQDTADSEGLLRILKEACSRVQSPDRDQQLPASPPAPRPKERLSHQALGTYACEDVPGTLRLSVADGKLFLWRRGTCEHLIPNGPASFCTADLRVTVPHNLELAATPLPAPDRFTLHLGRAPNLHYQRTGD